MVRWERAKSRAGLAKQKTISERAGTGRKPHPQKKTGRARAGNKRAPHHLKGGRAHGQKNRDYSHGMNAKTRIFALRSLLSAKLQEGNLVVVENFDIGDSNEDAVAEMLRRLDVHQALLVDGPEISSTRLKKMVDHRNNLFRQGLLVPPGAIAFRKQHELVLERFDAAAREKILRNVSPGELQVEFERIRAENRAKWLRLDYVDCAGAMSASKLLEFQKLCVSKSGLARLEMKVKRPQTTNAPEDGFYRGSWGKIPRKPRVRPPPASF